MDQNQALNAQLSASSHSPDDLQLQQIQWETEENQENKDFFDQIVDQGQYNKENIMAEGQPNESFDHLHTDFISTKIFQFKMEYFTTPFQNEQIEQIEEIEQTKQFEKILNSEQNTNVEKKNRKRENNQPRSISRIALRIITQIIKNLPESQIKQEFKQKIEDKRYSNDSKSTLIKWLCILERFNYLDKFYPPFLEKLKIQIQKLRIRERSQETLKFYEETTIETLELFSERKPIEALKKYYLFDQTLKRRNDYNQAEKEIIALRKDLGLP